MSNFHQDIGLERTTILVIEDDLHMRSLIAVILQGFGVGNVLRANDGYSAIELMNEVRHNPVRAGALEIDLVITDRMMGPVDGAHLVRWLRRDRESLDRFMPIIMISGYSGKDDVTTARDLGVHQFVAKPFSINTLAAQIMSVARDKRPFVKTGDYFGPDRRRRGQPVEVERRGADQGTRKGVRFLTPTNRLRMKTSGELTIPAERISRAEEELADWHEDFLDWVSDYLDRIEAASQSAVASQDARHRRHCLDEINAICHELRGQGGLFGYPLISTIAGSLFQLTYRITEVSEACLKLVGEHLDALRAVRRDGIRHDGGEVGRELVAALQSANHDFIDDPENLAQVSKDFLSQTRAGLG